MKFLNLLALNLLIISIFQIYITEAKPGNGTKVWLNATQRVNSSDTGLTKAKVNTVFDNIERETNNFFKEKKSLFDNVIDNETKAYEKVLDEGLNQMVTELKSLDKSKIGTLDPQKVKDLFATVKKQLRLKAESLKGDVHHAVNEALKTMRGVEEKERTKAISSFTTDQSAMQAKLVEFGKLINETSAKTAQKLVVNIKTLLADESAKNLKAAQSQRDNLVREMNNKIKDAPTKAMLGKKVEEKFEQMVQKLREERNKTLTVLVNSLTVGNRTGAVLNRTNPAGTAYNYGKESGDEKFASTALPLQLSKPITLSAKMPFFGDSISSLCIDPFGRIVINNCENKTGKAEPDTVTPYHYSLLKTVYYREVKDAQTLGLIGGELKQVLPAAEYSAPTSAFLVTWELALRGGSPIVYQAVLASNGKYTFSMFNYVHVLNSQSPFQLGYCKSGVSCIQIDNSLVADKKGKKHDFEDVLSKSSNYDKPGKWLYRLDKRDESLLAKTKAQFKAIYEDKPMPR